MYEGIKIVQKRSKFIQEINDKWYYLNQQMAYSKPFDTQEKAKEALHEEYKTCIAKIGEVDGS